jgi:hypothetical protein
VALTPEEKRRFLKALEEDEEFKMAVSSTIGLGEILKELKRLREDFEKWIKIEKKRWEIPILTGVMIGREVEAYARGKGVRIMKL